MSDRWLAEVVACGVALAISLAGAAVAPAQEAVPPRLEPVVVETPRLIPDRRRTDDEERQEIQRTPGGVEIVGEETIRQSRGSNLQDVLEFVPGVLIRSRFGAADESQFSIRGSGLQNNFHLRGINVLIDGFFYGNADGFSDFEALELRTTKRIEIYKGANALRFGANTIGGAVNLVTKTGYDAGLIELEGNYGSFGFAKTYLGTGQVYGPFDLYAGVSNTDLQGYRQWSEQTRWRLYGTGGYVLPGGTVLRLDLGYTNNQEQLPGALTREQFRQNPRQAQPEFLLQRAERNYDYVRGAFSLWTPLGTTQAFEAKVQTNYQDIDHPLPFAVIDQNTTNWGVELRYLLAAPLFGLASRFTAGFQYMGERQLDQQLENIMGRRGALILNNINRAGLFGFYAEEQLFVTPTLELVLGGRVDYSPRSVDDRFTDQKQTVDYVGAVPKVGFVWQFIPTAQLFGNVSGAYQPPLLVEATAPGNLSAPLDSLKATKAWQFEVGTRGTIGPRLNWDAAIYDYELWDEIQNVNVRPFPGAPFTIPRFQNIPRSRHTGVEVGFDVLLLSDVARAPGLGPGGDTLRFRTAYTWSRFVFVDNETFNGNDLPGAPRNFVVAELRYQHTLGFFVAPWMEAVPKGYFVDSANTARTPAYALANVRLGYEYAPWKLGVYFEGRNLANTNYVSAVQVDDANGQFFFPGDGRAFYGGVAWRWR
jgi:iron complex outermembrane recepter protein